MHKYLHDDTKNNFLQPNVPILLSVIVFAFTNSSEATEKEMIALPRVIVVKPSDHFVVSVFLHFTAHICFKDLFPRSYVTIWAYFRGKLTKRITKNV